MADPTHWRVQPALRALAAGTAAGALLGVLIGGVGGRVAMGILAHQNPEDAGVISDDGFEMGRISLGGTAQLLVATLQFGLLAGLIYLALRLLAIGPRWFRVASLTAGGTAVFGAFLIHDDGVDFSLLDPDWLPVVLFLLVPLAFIPALALLTEHWLRPTSWFLTADLRKVAAVVLVWIAAGPLLLLAPLALGAAYLRHVASRHLSPALSGALAWAARLGLGAVGVVALLALVADIAAVT